MSDQRFDGVEIETGERPQAAIIWLHGLGADGHDFEPIVPELALGMDARFVFPHAPVRAVTINNGYRMRAWYDILGFGSESAQDEAGIRASAAWVDALVEREIGRGIEPAAIVLAGFSQGGAVALHAGLRFSRPLAGVLALSTYLPLADSLAAERSAVNAAMPIFMAHGASDPVLPLALGAASRRLLEAQGYAVEWHEYPMAHTLVAAEIADMRAWLERVLG